MAHAYLKLKMQTDKTIAENLEKALIQLKEEMTQTVKNVQSGAERASWYGSCLFDDYKDVCNQLRNEDSRMLSAVRQVYQRDDVVLDMVELYFRKVIYKISPQGQKNILFLITEKLAKHASDKASKLSLSYLIAKIITESHEFNDSHIKIINKTSLVAVNVLSFYGKMQNAAMSARRLRFQDPDYYWSLHNEKLEMLYYIIEPNMSKIIQLINSGSSNEEEITFLLNEIISL